MGYLYVEVDNNPLWGYKSELKENIKNEVSVRRFDITRKKWNEAKKQKKLGVRLVKYGTRYNRPWKERNWKRLPDDVKEKCKEWLENNREEIEKEDGPETIRFKYFLLEVDVSNRGNPKDLRIKAVFKDH